MGIDLSKLSPAPWFVNPRTGDLCHGDPNDDRDNYPIDDPDADEFVALARNAFAGDPEALAWWEANRVKAREAKESDK